MDIIDSMKKDKAYIKYKLIVKSWENDFKTKFSRTPSKFDIKEAPSKIKYAYKKYFQLKSAALESSLSLCNDDEEPIGSPDTKFILDNVPASPSLETSSPSELILPSLPSGQQLEELLLKAHTPTVHLKEYELKPASPFTKNLSKKLFQNSKFSLRNPRKSFLSKSQSFCDDNSSKFDKENKEEILESPFKSNSVEISEINSNKNSLETFADNLECENLKTRPTPSQNFDQMKTTTVRQLNQGWLERVTDVIDTNESKNENSETSDKFGISNIKIKNIHNFQKSVKSVTSNFNIHDIEEKNYDYVENSESETEDITIQKLKPALKKRKTNDYNFINTSEDRHKNIDEHIPESSLNNSKETKTKRKPHMRKKENVPKSVHVKQTSQTMSTKHNVTNDTAYDEPPDIAEYMPFGLDNHVKPRHSKPVDILETIDPSNKESNKTSQSEGLETIAKKIANGTLNENFVRINIEKKVFVRGKKGINFSKYKKQQWKDKKALHASMEFPESGKISCFKCGAAGHMARYCTAHRGDSLLPLQSYDESDIPTLQDMQGIVLKESNNISVKAQLQSSNFEPSPIPEAFLKMLHDTTNSSNVKPVFSNYDQDTPAELTNALQKFGHNSFRPGQKEAIMRILCGKSTLLILSTGGGKSLCYQLPAYIYSQHYKCITLVISPLVSLMEDQVLSMPEFLRAGCLHNNQSPTQRRKIIQYLKDGEINILLISPEALISGDGSNGFTGLFKSLPQIAFVCIDEAHCVSQWSHNFRPSYLMICRVLREKLNVKCILGLTATASQTTIKSVISHIDIVDGFDGVITNPTLPDNLYLAVSFEKDKDRALVSLIVSDRISDYNSIIVYCIRRDECERVAAILRSCLQQQGSVNMEKKNNKRKRMSFLAEAYHAGISAAQRKKIQKHFMDGTLRIIVATVAFGMGINKPDIRCIIHYNMPSSFESYVQEVGRAGRDGEPAYCHVFMSNSNNDRNELLKHIHSDTIDRPTIRKILKKVFIPCKCITPQEEASTSKTIIARCKGHEVGVPIDSTVEELDLPSENIATLLCYIELHDKQYIKVLNNAYTMCKIISYGGPHHIVEATKNCPPLAMAYLLESKRDPDIMKKSIFEFNVIEVAAAIGWESGMTKYHLKNLEWITESGSSRRSQLKMEFNTLGFRINAPGDLSPAELDSILDDIHSIVKNHEKAMLYQLEESYRAFSKLGNYSLENNCLSLEALAEKSNELKLTIRQYFQRESNMPSDTTLEERPLDTERVKSDVRALISSYKDCTFTGRSVARIFQGISSPNYPALVWGRCKFWRSHIHEDFYGLMKIATQEIIQMK